MDKMEYTQQEIETIARVAHEAVRAFNQSIGDPVQAAWDDSPEWMRASCINGVFFHLETIRTPEESHENWMRSRAADGWVYGPVKSEEAKTHPCMVSYAELPRNQRIKDHLFVAIVDAFTKERS